MAGANQVAAAESRPTYSPNSADTIEFDGGHDESTTATPWQVVPLQNAWTFSTFNSPIDKLCGSRKVYQRNAEEHLATRHQREHYGLVRQYLPKGIDLLAYSHHEVEAHPILTE